MIWSQTEYKIYMLSFCAKVGEPTIMKGSYGPSHLSCLFSGRRSSTLLVTACQLLFVLVSPHWCSSCFRCPLRAAPPFTQPPVTCSCYIVKTAIEPDWRIVVCGGRTSKNLDGASQKRSAQGYFPLICASHKCISAAKRERNAVPSSARVVSGLL